MTKKKTEFELHAEELLACALCPMVEGRPVTGIVPDARVLLLGQAPGPREAIELRPFAYTAGKRLFSWFERLGVSEEKFRARVYMAAVIRCFPGRDPKAGGDRVPNQEEIERCGVHFDREIRLLRPELVIGVGTLAAGVLIGDTTLSRIVGKMHRAERAGHSFDLVILPHPSGRSTWLNKPENRELLERSLKLIDDHPGFAELKRS